MARKARGRVHAGVYHVWRRTAGPILMFRDDDDRTDFCNRLARAITRFEWQCMSFVLMPTHFHFLLWVDDDVLSPGMSLLFGGYAQQFNRRWSRKGHLKAEPFKLRRINDDADLQGVVRYIARNPVRDRLCELPQDWAWSSYRGSAEYATSFPFVNDRDALACFHETHARAIRQLRVFVEID